MPVSNSSVLVDSSIDRREIHGELANVRWRSTAPRPSIGFAQQIEHAAQRRVADGNGHRSPRIDALLTAHHAVRAAQRNAANATAAQVLLHFARSGRF